MLGFKVGGIRPVGVGILGYFKPKGWGVQILGFCMGCVLGRRGSCLQTQARSLQT